MFFEFATAQRILFGPGTLAQAGAIAAALGRHALVVTGGSPDRAGPLVDLLGQAGVARTHLGVSGEPTVDAVAAGADRARAAGCDMVISFGGGSAIDAGKAIAALLANGGEPLDYLEVVGRGLVLAVKSAPHLAIPTTAGTGSEVTRNAVLGSPSHGIKASMRSVHMLPAVALIDPELTYSVPPPTTAATGLDALTQVIEPFVSPRANPLVDALCMDAIPRAARSLRRACSHPGNADAREEMSLVSLYGGLALANAGLGAVHGFAGPFGGMFSAGQSAAGHGAICAALLPHVTAANVAALSSRLPDSPALDRYGRIARLLTGREDARPEDAAPWLLDLVRDLRIPSLRQHGLDEESFPELVQKASQASSMKGNPVALTPQEMENILRLAL